MMQLTKHGSHFAQYDNVYAKYIVGDGNDSVNVDADVDSQST